MVFEKMRRKRATALFAGTAAALTVTDNAQSPATTQIDRVRAWQAAS